ncbi:MULTISPECIES: DUF2948 family protein [unclassified Iodidimonas]|jgi:hypothetical protein|uniref:DUF2948 family protein n=1 Tax=unclassified Iodidimonas TaxID=2626145 RepID=UPI002482DDBA|nr:MULTISPECIES: DUF2948 family protein [unclassified Iodidimonas]
MTEKLKLMAHSPEDLGIISAALQDSVLRVGDMAWLPGQHRFAAVANRYRWEKIAGREQKARKSGRGQRVRAGLHFDGILKVQVKNIALDQPDQVIALLAIELEPGADGSAVINLIFAGGAHIRLDAECVDAVLSDLSDDWPALRVPDHNLS